MNTWDSSTLKIYIQNGRMVCHGFNFQNIIRLFVYKTDKNALIFENSNCNCNFVFFKPTYYKNINFKQKIFNGFKIFETKLSQNRKFMTNQFSLERCAGLGVFPLYGERARGTQRGNDKWFCTSWHKFMMKSHSVNDFIINWNELLN